MRFTSNPDYLQIAVMLAQGLFLQWIPRKETVAMHTDDRRGIRCGQRNQQGRGSIYE